MTTRESVELFEDTVDTARQGIQQSFAGSEKAGEALRPKLTVDLVRRNLGQIPSEVVSIIRQDVERYLYSLPRIALDFVRILYNSVRRRTSNVLTDLLLDFSWPTTSYVSSLPTSPHAPR